MGRNPTGGRFAAVSLIRVAGVLAGLPLIIGLARLTLLSVGLPGDTVWVLSIAVGTLAAGAAAFVLSRRADAERQRADAESNRADAGTRYRILLDMAPAAIMVRAADGTITYWNKAAEQLYGWSADEAVGRSSHELLSTAIVRAADAVSAVADNSLETLEALSGDAWQGELSQLTKAGKRVPIRSHWAVRADEAVAGAVIEVDVDISAEKSDEAALRAQSLEIEAAGLIDRIGSRVMTAFNRNSAAPAAAADALEALSDEAGYKPLALYEYDEWQATLTLLGGLALAPGFRNRTYQLGTGLVGKAAESRRAEFVDSSSGSTWVLDTGTGELQAATVFAIPLMFREQLLGCLAGASAIALSDRERSWLGQIADQMAIGLRTIQQLTQLRALSAELSDRSRRIELQNVELAESSRLKSDFLSSMSHELRTPLNAIIGFSEVLKDGLLGELPSEQLDYTTEIYNAGKHLLSLINDILDLSKIEAGKMELDIEPVELDPLIENSITVVKGFASGNDVEVTTRVDPSVTTIEADARKLRQILYNLLSNAVKFTPNGGNVGVEATARGADVEIAVTDTGIGISPEEQRKLFVPFEQLDSGISRRFEGTGLGLATVKKLAELHGGEVGVSSEVGRGSRFWVRLPQSQSGRAPSAGVRGTGITKRTSTETTVLVVESDTRQADVIRKSLGRIGVHAVIVADPLAVKGLAEEQSFHAIVLNLETCASAEGISFLAERESHDKLSGIPLIALSPSEDEPAAVDLRATRVLPAPVSEDALMGALRALGIGLAAEQPSPTVLVVDDDPKAVSYVCTVLEAAGMTTARAYGGQEALDAIADSTVNAVVLDLMMPDVSGFDVLLQLRADPATRDLPVVVLTAKSLTVAERASLNQMASAVVEKSRWQGSRFAAVVRDAVNSSMGAPVPARVRPSTSGAPRRPDAILDAGANAVVDVGESGAHILVLGDEESEREPTRNYLQDAGYRVTVAASAQQATDKLGDDMPDLAVVHLSARGRGGLNSVQLLRKDPRYSEVPIVVFSEADHPDRAVALGANIALPKPIQRAPFLQAIDNLLGASIGSPRVLLVDDDLNVLRVLSKYFEGEDFVVDRADGGQAALDLIARRPPDLMVLDLMMPDVNGFDVLRSLRSNPATADMPVAVLTAMDLSEADRSTLELAQAVLQKGKTTNSELLNEVRRLLIGAPNPTGAG